MLSALFAFVGEYDYCCKIHYEKRLFYKDDNKKICSIRLDSIY